MMVLELILTICALTLFLCGGYLTMMICLKTYKMPGRSKKKL